MWVIDRRCFTFEQTWSKVLQHFYDSFQTPKANRQPKAIEYPYCAFYLKCARFITSWLVGISQSEQCLTTYEVYYPEWGPFTCTNTLRTQNHHPSCFWELWDIYRQCFTFEQSKILQCAFFMMILFKLQKLFGSRKHPNLLSVQRNNKMKKVNLNGSAHFRYAKFKFPTRQKTQDLYLFAFTRKVLLECKVKIRVGFHKAKEFTSLRSCKIWQDRMPHISSP